MSIIDDLERAREMFDRHEVPADGRCAYVNEDMARELGVPEEEIQRQVQEKGFVEIGL